MAFRARLTVTRGRQHAPTRDRAREWFVPAFGPRRFRVFVGLLFLPYTAMVLSYTVIGSMLAGRIAWDRVVAIVLIYSLGLGVAAHALDALGGKAERPWGNMFTRRQLWALAGVSLVLAYTIGTFYIVLFAPWLALVALLEGFFVFAYNLEWMGGRFHTDGWFAFSWGALPVLAGYVLQTNDLSAAAVVTGTATGFLSLVEIRASRPYKALRRRPSAELSAAEEDHMRTLESVLKSISMGVITLGAAMVLWRLTA